MDFFEHQAVARRHTVRLIFYFAISVCLVAVAVYFAVVFSIQAFEDTTEGGHSLEASTGISDRDFWNRDLFVATTVSTVAFILLASLVKLFALRRPGSFVALTLGARRIVPDTERPEERMLLNIVEEMAIASGTPVPDLFVLDRDKAINAFAAGHTPRDAVIGVTRGCLEYLSRDEMQGVIAHEFSHILNGDMRLNLRMVGVLFGIMELAVIGLFLIRIGLVVDDEENESRRLTFGRRDRRGGSWHIALLGLFLTVIGYLGYFLGSLIKSSISQQREFLADASAVQFTRNSAGISEALKKIGGIRNGSRVGAGWAVEFNHMFFGVVMPMTSLLSTHPPLVERIRRIDPAFDGRFPTVAPVRGKVVELETAKLFADPSAPAAPKPVVRAEPQAPAAGDRFHAETALEAIGAPTPSHLEYAAHLRSSIPDLLTRCAHEPLGSQAVIFALLLVDSNRQDPGRLGALEAGATPGVFEQVQKLMPQLAELSSEARLPLMELAIPALREMSPEQFKKFRKELYDLVEADDRISAFEYAIHRMLLRHLEPHFQEEPKGAIQAFKVTAVLRETGQVLSVLAHHGNPGDLAGAERAFSAGADHLQGEGQWVRLLTPEQSGIPLLDGALAALEASSPDVQRTIMKAFTACVHADGLITIEEAELLRAIADALNCPMPPLLPGESFGEQQES